MVVRQPSWNKYEAAILLEGLLDSMKGKLTRLEAIKVVSHDLRAMALHRGMEIDEAYRNTNGILFQMKSMESAYLGRTVFKPATKLFEDVAGLYHESYDEYKKLLREARAMVIEEKIVDGSSTIEEVLRQYFQKGFRMDSPLEIRKLKKYYTATHDRELTDPDDDVREKIRRLCIIYSGKAFLSDVMLSEELKDELLNYIETAFADGKAAIYYQALFDAFSDAFLDYHIHNADMLKSYLAFIGNGRFFINRNFISKTPDVSMDPLSEVRSFLQNQGRPATYNELFKALPHLSQSKIKSILAGNVEFVNNGRGEYFHESIVCLSNAELDGIFEIIQRTIDEKDFIAGNELYAAIRAKYPYIIDENPALSAYGFRDAMKAKSGGKFSFKGNIISRSGQELRMADVFANYAKRHDTFTLSELQSLADNLATPIYFESIYENSLRISRDQFVAKNAASFSVEAMDEVLDRICPGKYIPLPEATNFGAFPYAGFPWNIFLLEHYVASYSQKYMLLHSGFNGTECAGAIVRRSANIVRFDDLIVDLLANNQIEMAPVPALQFLSDKGYLARRRYSEIESLIIKANAQRQRKDTD